MIREVIAFGGYYDDFMATLTEKEALKVEWVISLLETQDRLPTKFIKHIQEGIYELRIKTGSNIYRIFFIFDDDKIVVLFNGFQKKTQKTPKNEIEKAIKIKNEYYEYKQQNKEY